MKTLWTLGRKHGSHHWDVLISPAAGRAEQRKFLKGLRIAKKHDTYCEVVLAIPVRKLKLERAYARPPEQKPATPAPQAPKPAQEQPPKPAVAPKQTVPSKPKAAAKPKATGAMSRFGARVAAAIGK